jgi:hypothetical protein
MHPWEWLRTVSISISGMASVYYLHPVWGIAIRNRSECWLWFHDNLSFVRERALLEVLSLVLVESRWFTLL